LLEAVCLPRDICACSRDLTSDCSSFVVPGLQLRKILLKITIIRISHVLCCEMSPYIYIYMYMYLSVAVVGVCVCVYIYICVYIYRYKVLYRVSQEECARLRESVPYVKLYRYNPKHLYPKLNGCGDNGQRSLKL
jgi:hypothetical protein